VTDRPDMISDRLGYPPAVGDEAWARIRPNPTLPCCATWDDNPVIAETPLMRAVLDGYPVTEGHALVYPKRHVDRLYELTGQEMADAFYLIECAQNARVAGGAEDFTIAVNDGPLAGRTVPHLHVHVIPRRAGDVADPRGGVRRLLLDAADDPWTNREPRAAALPEHLRGDGPCHNCGTPDNVCWFAESPFWNHVMGGPQATDDPGGILCIPCFVKRADAAGFAPPGWRLMPDWHWETHAERRVRRAADLSCQDATCPNFGDPDFGEATCPESHAGTA
jgi:diadenosine tetraphosphate (Ap4A) HIT family hydrolase